MSETVNHLESIEPLKQNIIKGLQKIQEKEGYLSDDALAACVDYFGIPAAELEGVVSFYSQFKRNKPGKYKISVCDGTACHIKGASLIVDWIKTDIGVDEGQTDSLGLFSLETVACLGCCSLAPVVSVNGQVFGNLNRRQTLKTLKKYKKQG